MNITTILEMAADAFPDRVAMVAGDTRLTYAQLLYQSRSAGGFVKASAARYLAVLDVSSVATPVAIFGAAFGGVPYVPLNYRLTDGELNDLVKRIKAAVLVTNEVNRQRLQSDGGVALVVRAEFLATAARGGREPVLADDERAVAVQLFTSGTTGKPKAAILRHENLMSYILGTVEFASAGEDDATLITVPPYHIAGISAVLSATYACRRAVFLENFDPVTWLSTCQRENVSNAFLVPTMLARIVDELARAPEAWHLPRLKAIAFGGGKMPLAVITKAMELFPNVDFTNAYGLTETSSTICLLDPEDHRTAMSSPDPAIRRRLASVGRPISAVEIQIRDPEANTLPPEVAGDIFVRGGQVAGEYLGIGSALDAEGWFPTRDRGFLDADGFLFLDGRADDVIVRGGENISPGEIEEVLLAHPCVADVAVVAVPDQEWGEGIGAAIVLREGAPAVSIEQLQLWVKERLRSSRVPALVEFRSELPYNELGKILRRLVRDDLKHRAAG